MINQFQGQFRFLSNFFPVEVKWDGHKFPTVEHAFVFAKTIVPEEQMIVLMGRALTAGRIKRLGRSLTLRDDWGEDRIRVMKELVRSKFQIPTLREKLLATGEEDLVEGNSWNDVFWGVNLETGDGENHLGIILMEVREEIKHESLTSI
jgi:ribA/ribD-fused uncharacterized protein